MKAKTGNMHEISDLYCTSQSENVFLENSAYTSEVMFECIESGIVL